MKYIILLGDGMADYPLKELGEKTPLQVAFKPNMDKLAKIGKVGMVKTVPDQFSPGSDVANLSVLGYAPEKYYSGRSPLEALSMNINLSNEDVAARCNLVTLSEEVVFEEKTMIDYSAGEITTEEAKELIMAVKDTLENDIFNFTAGVSYRHCLVIKNGSVNVDLTPPHDITDRKITEYLPKGDFSKEFLDLIKKSGEILKDHPINIKRKSEGKRPATHIWLWGVGTKPMLIPFKDITGLDGGMISAVDLLKGIAKGACMTSYDVEGANGTLHTNFKGKTQALFKALESGKDFVYLHLECADESGHQGNVKDKILSIEKIDEVLGDILSYMEEKKENFCIAVLPDHRTPLALKTHTKDAVPYIIYCNLEPNNSNLSYDEVGALDGEYFENGQMIIKNMLKYRG